MKAVKSMPNFEHCLQLPILHLPGVRIAYENTVKLLCPFSMFWERSGSAVECLTRDRGAAGSNLIGFTALWSLSKTHLS